MQPQNLPTPSFELPQPTPSPNGGENVEHVGRPASFEHQPSGRAGAPLPAAMMSPAHVPLNAPPSVTPKPPAGRSATPALADDADLIEKAWVEKAKAIVAQTRHDPYEQNRALTNFKADYMKKRFNMDIKQAD